MNLEELYEKYEEAGAVSTDTRQIIPGSIFFALKGPNFNANTFAVDALKQGAKWAVVDDDKYVTGPEYILVRDGLESLQQLAKKHRSKLKIPVVGLTGSNGKTTTKELLNAVFSKKYKTLATKGNLNNHIGVPLTILRIDSSIEIAIIEMGANHVGEIADLCSIAQPTHGLITNIGKGHVGMFGGFDNIVRAKSELYQHLITNDGQVFINSQNPILANMAKRFKAPLFYPAPGDYYSCRLLSADPFVEIEAEDKSKIATKIIGAYNFENIAAGLCLGKFFGVDEGEANDAIRDYSPGNMRSQVIRTLSNTIVLDAYNANPSSMEAAITNLAGINAPNKVAILGDMYELGEESEKEHRNLGKLLASNGITTAYLCGVLIKAALDTFPNARYFVSKEQLVQELTRAPIKNSTVLVKASRGMGLETIVEQLA